MATSQSTMFTTDGRLKRVQFMSVGCRGFRAPHREPIPNRRCMCGDASDEGWSGFVKSGGIVNGLTTAQGGIRRAYEWCGKFVGEAAQSTNFRLRTLHSSMNYDDVPFLEYTEAKYVITDADERAAFVLSAACSFHHTYESDDESHFYVRLEGDLLYDDDETIKFYEDLLPEKRETATVDVRYVSVDVDMREVDMGDLYGRCKLDKGWADISFFISRVQSRICGSNVCSTVMVSPYYVFLAHVQFERNVR